MTKAQQIVVASAVVAVISIAGYGFRYSLGIVQGSEDAQEQLELWKKNGFPLKEEDVFIGGRTPDEENAAIALMNIIEGPAPKLTLPASIKKSDWEAGTVQAYLESRQSLIQDIEQA